MPGAYDIDRDQLAALLPGQPRYRVEQVWRGLWERGERPSAMTELPKALRYQLEAALPQALQEVSRWTSSDRRTTKWLWQLHDGAQVESVLMHYRDRATVCVSSQAGCAMGCRFCATGQMGFVRHLTAGEIVEQVVLARREALPRRLSNVVLMGMGEPLANYDRVWAAIVSLRSELGISARHITVSTVGVVPGVRRLAHEALPVNLAVSLHAARDSLRSELVPLNRRYPLSVLMAACSEYVHAKNRRLSFEWALIDGVNDTARDADELAELALPLGAHVNLIPLNPTAGYPLRATPPAGIAAFFDQLTAQGVNATVRSKRGNDINAACGQLAARVARAPGPAPSHASRAGVPN
ncbi:MAG: 23S rRNA (adenine(2503)-C(2))-methyltransferase RlmN [Acidimicrobiales bacterium]